LTNTSFTQVPLSVDEPIALRKHLQKVVEQIDIIEGNRAGDPYVKDSDLPAVNLSALDTSVTTLSDAVAKIQASLDDITDDIDAIQAITDVTRYTIEYRNLNLSVFYDFNGTAWSTFQGKGQMGTVGSNYVSPPIPLNPLTIYQIYVESARTNGGGITQSVMIEDTGVDLKVFYRTGDTFALALSNGWTQV